MKSLTHSELLRVDFNKTAKVLENFLKSRLMPVEHNTGCTQDRVCLFYFLITGSTNLVKLCLGRCPVLGSGAR